MVAVVRKELIDEHADLCSWIANDCGVSGLFFSVTLGRRFRSSYDSRVEVPEVISAEQRCFIVLTFFSADSENTINISADQLCFRADQL